VIEKEGGKRILRTTLWFTLLRLAEAEGESKTVRTSTPELASRIGYSQQTASRHLRELERLGFIKRMITGRGESVTITERGRRELYSTYIRLKAVLEGEKTESIILKGQVVSGVGEGAYYMDLKGYRDQFKTGLGFDPYPGTLNIQLSESSLLERKLLDSTNPIIIKGFEDGKRTYGDVRCFKAIIQGNILGAVVIIDRTHYSSSILEVIAPVGLRKELKLKDDDTVRVKILLGDTDIP
jgi:riboflavin kinase